MEDLAVINRKGMATFNGDLVVGRKPILNPRGTQRQPGGRFR
jgi:hypothetical protein